MKLWGIAMDIASIDGEQLLSIWTTKEAAEFEVKSLKQGDPIWFSDSLRIIEFESDVRGNVANEM